MIEEKESNMIYILKAFAIISVVCAHVSLVPNEFSQTTVYVNCIMNEIGAIGVGIFFAVSGYLFGKSNKEEKFVSFAKKKLRTIGIPWLISATLVYVYVGLRKGGTVYGWLFSTLGYMSSYWYLSVLFVLYIIFFFIRQQKKDDLLAIFLMITSIISIILRVLGIIKQDCFGVYLNIFNWSIFYSIGYIYSKKEKTNLGSNKNKAIALILGVIVLGILLVFPVLKIDKFSYFSYIYIPVEIGIIYICIEISYFLSKRECRILKLIGALSFSIYLYNELLWAGLIVNIGNKVDCWPLLLLRPILVLGAVIGELLLGRKIFSLYNKENIFDALTGVRLK